MRCKQHSIDAEETERSCGFLTQTEREYLLGEWSPGNGDSDPTEEQVRVKESDIRTRTRHALADFALLRAHASDDLLQSIYLANEDPAVFNEQTANDTMKGLLQFVSLAMVGEDITKLLYETLNQEDMVE